MIFGVALALRCAWVLVHGLRGSAADGLTFPDEEQYWALAKSLAAGHGLVDEFGYRATFMPLYPAFLSLFVGWTHGMLVARIVQAAIGAAAVIPISLLANRLAGRRAAIASAMLVALDPFLVFGFSNLLLTETIFTTLLCAAIFAAWPMTRANASRARACSEDSACPCPPWLRAIVAGVLFAAAIYVRPSVTAFVPLWAIVCWLVARDRGRAATTDATFVVTVVLLLVPWAVRNHRVLDEWEWLTTRSGISLYDGIGPRAAGGSDLAYTKTMPNVRGMSETQWSGYFSREAWRIARDDPGRVVRLAWTKFKRTWSFVPNEPGSRTPVKMLASAVWMSVVLAAGVIGIIRMRRGREAVLLLMPAVYFTLLHMVFVGSVRYRIPAMPLIYVLSGWAVARRPAPPPDGAADG